MRVALVRIGLQICGVLLAGLFAGCGSDTPGNGTAPTPNPSPTPLSKGNSLANHIASGSYHVCAIGSLKCWGDNSAGQLGQGDTVTRGDDPGEMGNALPDTLTGVVSKVAAVAAGAAHTCALLENATIKCWGDNSTGQLGQGNTTALGDNAGEMGNALPVVALGTGRTAVAIATGAQHTCALLDDTTIKCWGDNSAGQLGQGDTVTRGDDPGEMGDALSEIDLGTGRTAVAIATGAQHTCALLDDATLKCWGNNSAGQLGQGDVLDRGDGAGEMGDALLAIDLGTGRTAVAIAAGALHTCALLDNATVKCWGDNSAGQLGQGDVLARGDGAGEMGDALLAIDLGVGRTAVAITAGALHTCALLDTHKVKCWGDNSAGQLGQGDTVTRGDDPGEMGDALPVIDLGLGRTVLEIAVGSFHTCVLLDTHRVKCWGDNSAGQLGQGDVLNRGDGPGEMGNALPTINFG